MNSTDIKSNGHMYDLYEDYKNSLSTSKQALRKRQKLNAEMREEYESPFKRLDYNSNKNDITHWNSMVNELEENMKMIEMYLDFDDRVLLHRDYNNMKSMILNQNSYEGEIPIDDMYGESVPDIADIVCDVELQEEIVELLDKVLTERQKEVVHLYFWQEKTQEEIGEIFGITKQAINETLSKSISLLRESLNKKDSLESYY